MISFCTLLLWSQCYVFCRQIDAFSRWYTVWQITCMHVQLVHYVVCLFLLFSSFCDIKQTMMKRKLCMSSIFFLLCLPWWLNNVSLHTDNTVRNVSILRCHLEENFWFLNSYEFFYIPTYGGNVSERSLSYLFIFFVTDRSILFSPRVGLGPGNEFIMSHALGCVSCERPKIEVDYRDFMINN